MMEVSPRWRETRIFAILPIATLMGMMGCVGCGRAPLAPREPFTYSRTWQVSDANSPFELVAALSPQPLIADQPAMLEVRMKRDSQSKISQPRVWYRFARRRGEPLQDEHALVSSTPFAPEEGLEPRYDDWFEWAEIVEPRSENGEPVFTTPVMFSQGKIYVQFRVSEEPESAPRELLDWFIYVN